MYYIVRFPGSSDGVERPCRWLLGTARGFPLQAEIGWSWSQRFGAGVVTVVMGGALLHLSQTSAAETHGRDP